jgi:5-methylthioadenosine/S-adenosylhomocysteine deaminase
MADIAAVRIDTLCAQPLYDPPSSLVYTSSGSRVSDVWVGGKRLLNDRQLTTLDENDLLLQRAISWGEKITARKKLPPAIQYASYRLLERICFTSQGNA